MIKKILETSLGNWGQTWFSRNRKRVGSDEAIRLIENECNPYKTKDSGGVLVYFSREEFEKLKTNYPIKD